MVNGLLGTHVETQDKGDSDVEYLKFDESALQGEGGQDSESLGKSSKD